MSTLKCSRSKSFMAVYSSAHPTARQHTQPAKATGFIMDQFLIPFVYLYYFMCMDIQQFRTLDFHTNISGVLMSGCWRISF